jgi:EAL domain-containing protein (putative c-di-GMP-specific phosphodiesterase class I)
MDGNAWQESTRRLRALGFALAVDDVGSGYNSLAVLANLKPEFLKIDMGLVRDVHLDSSKQRLVELLCQFARATGATVVAEGIEKQEEADVVIAAGVSLMQGYLFGKPQL